LYDLSKELRMRKMKNNINYEIALDMINGMPEEKKKALRKSLERNWILTSSYIMESGYMVIYKEGFYLILNGTRCSFSVFAYDKDGEFEFARKPHENRLNKIYDDYLKFSEDDFRKI